MEGTYQVFLAEKAVGTVTLTRLGLYYEVICNCSYEADEMLELMAAGEGFRENLGLLIPLDGGFGLKKRIAAKRLGQGKITFSLISRNSADVYVVDVAPEKEFQFLQYLDHAFLVQDGEKVKIGFRKNNTEKGKIRG